MAMRTAGQRACSSTGYRPWLFGLWAALWRAQLAPRGSELATCTRVAVARQPRGLRPVHGVVPRS
eukprot:12200901-Alexandrium_andersonii.AAC.1